MPPAAPPEFFIDRSLGRNVVPAALRAAGATVHTMAEVYGERIGQGLSDEEWLRDAGAQNWIVLMKDARIRRRPTELNVLIAHQVRAFCLTNANLRGDEQAQRLVSNLPQILRVAATPGPYIYGVYAHSVARLWPNR